MSLIAFGWIHIVRGLKVVEQSLEKRSISLVPLHKLWSKWVYLCNYSKISPAEIYQYQWKNHQRMLFERGGVNFRNDRMKQFSRLETRLETLIKKSQPGFSVLEFQEICNKKIRKKISKRMRLEIISSLVNTTVMNFSVFMVFVFEVFTTDLAQSIHDKFHWVRIHNSTKSASEGKNKRGQLNSSPCFQNRFLNPLMRTLYTRNIGRKFQ